MTLPPLSIKMLHHSSELYTIYLKEMLMGQITAGVEFKDEDMIHSSLPPAICVNAKEKEEFYQEKTTSINSYEWPHIWSFNIKHT